MEIRKKIIAFGLCALALALASCASAPEPPARQQAGGKLALTAVSFSDLKDWQLDAPGETLAAFRRSCTQLMAKPAGGTLGVAGKIAAWRQACAAAQNAGDGDEAARAFFESHFRPYAASAGGGDDGLFTGYYAPELNGARERGGAFQTPLYARPGDLISVDLGLFKSSLKGQHIVGKVTGTKMVPYDNRAEIARGSLDGRAQVLVWIDDPIGAFFLEVQGSGRVRLADGDVITVGYDGANGRSYEAIGRIMAERGDIRKPVTMPGIKAWLADHPDQAQAVMDENPSYVFFRRLPDAQVVGAEGVDLTPGRSIAVDPAFVPLGVPVFIDTYDGQGNALRRLAVAQDAGGAIKGPVRADFFWGEGEQAGAQAGAMQSRGRYYLLLPNGAQPSAASAADD